MAVASVGVLRAPFTFGALAEGAGLRAGLVVVASLPMAALAAMALLKWRARSRR